MSERFAAAEAAYYGRLYDKWHEEHQPEPEEENVEDDEEED